MKVAFLSPLPPARTGIAHYAAMLLPALRERVDVETFGEGEIARYDPGRFDNAIYQLGNNPHHEIIYRAAMESPGVVVLHDVVLHHLIVEMTLARGDEEAYVASLRASHGEAGAAWARGRAIGLHDEIANFLLPASIDVANRSRAVIVHNQYAAERLRSFGVSTPIHLVPHPFQRVSQTWDRAEVRQRLGFSPDDQVIGLFGFLTSAKRAEVVVEAFRLASRDEPRLRLLVVGEPAPDIDMSRIAGAGVVVTGYVADDEFGAYYAATDRLVNLRYPSAGETSGTLIRAFEAGKPVAVSDYAQFAEFPDACAVKVPLGTGEVERLAAFMTGPIDTRAIAGAQTEWLETHARLDLTVEGYLLALAEKGPRRSQPAIEGAVPLFARVELLGAERREGELALKIRNAGEAFLRARVYGEPGYRAIVRVFSGTEQVEGRWLELTGDLAPGATAELVMPFHGRADRITLQSALQGIAIVEQPAAEIEVR